LPEVVHSATGVAGYGRSTGMHPSVKTNGNGPGSPVEYNPSKNTIDGWDSSHRSGKKASTALNATLDPRPS
jgi:hypothetical protein